MIPAIILFAATYVLMISFGKYRTWFALASGLLVGLFLMIGGIGILRNGRFCALMRKMKVYHRKSN